jgi:hypothetical protein
VRWPNLTRCATPLTGDRSVGATKSMSGRLSIRLIALVALAVILAVVYESTRGVGRDLPYSHLQPTVIGLDLPAASRGQGGVITADLNDDGKLDFLVSKVGHLAAYDGSGARLWVKQVDIQLTEEAETHGLPGLHAPGVQVADADGDGRTEVLLLDRRGALLILDGRTGDRRRRVAIPSPPGAQRWEHLVVANFRGRGDRDLLLQATNADGYRMGRFLAAYGLDDLMGGNRVAPLWTQYDFVANAHNGARVADLDGRGRDYVLGATVVGPEGRILFKIPVRGHVDSIFAYDVRPDVPGIEIVALEEGGGNRVFLYNGKRLLWETHFLHREPQNAAVGNFDPDRAGLEVWCRSRYDTGQKPFVFDASGHVIATYELDKHAPAGWTTAGVETIVAVDWTGESKQLAAAKERHRAGDVAIFDPLTGRFLHRFKERADRLFVADVSGDSREEIIVLSGSELRIYANDAPHPNPSRARLWDQQSYRRSKMTWNYYSP